VGGCDALLLVREASVQLWRLSEGKWCLSAYLSAHDLDVGGLATACFVASSASAAREGVWSEDHWLVGTTEGELLVLHLTELTLLSPTAVQLRPPDTSTGPVSTLLSLAVSHGRNEPAEAAADGSTPLQRIAAGWSDGSVGLYALPLVRGAAPCVVRG